MQFFYDLKELFDKNNEFIETKNAYFETHICNGVTTKVSLDFTISNEKTGDELVIGKCKNCNKVFYNVN